MGKMDEKWVRRPNWYRCATVGCEIEADMGRMLLRCTFVRFLSSSSHFFFLETTDVNFQFL